MRSPSRLIGQVAAEVGATPLAVKRAIYLKGLAEDGAGVERAKKALSVSSDNLKKLCRKFMIDLADYRPYARLENKGEARPAAPVKLDAL